MKVVLSRYISPEQSSFLLNRSIHDVVGVTQEILHSIKSQKLASWVMKVDLKKAYDKVDWAFLNLILFKIGLGSDTVDWIMGCISSTYMVVIVNGTASIFFKPDRSLRQGCALSPLLFILVMDALSLKISRAVELGSFRGIKISSRKEISHNLIFDDVLVFGILIKICWLVLQDIFRSFDAASGMEANGEKPCIFHPEGDREIVDYIDNLFIFRFSSIDGGLHYLGFSPETSEIPLE